jgi:hypothetical protein
MARLTVIGLAALLALALAAPASGAVRHAHVLATKSSGTCPIAAPCHVKWAIEGAAAGDEVIIAPGTYNITSGPVATKAITIRGTAGESRPRLVVPADENDHPLLVSTNEGTAVLRHLQLENAHPGFAALALGGKVDIADVVAVSRGDDGYALFLGTSGDVIARDSVFRSTRKAGTAVMNYGGDLVLRNVTAIAQGESSVGLRSSGICEVQCTLNQPANIDAVNVIARGLGNDVSVSSSYAGAPATTNLSHSNWRPDHTSATSNTSINDLGNNQSADPLFRNAPFGDFHQLAGSPTVDKGTVTPQNGTTDYDGQARVNGAAPDIGADEFHSSSRPGGGGSGGGEGGEGEGGEGGETGGTGGVEGNTDTTAPVTGNLALKPVRFPAARKGLSIAAVKTGAKVTYALSEAATVVFFVERGSAGRSVGGKCVKPTKSNAKRKRCTRWKLLKGGFAHAGVAGPNKFRFTGRLDGKTLSPARYRLLALPSDAAGNVGQVARAGFEVIR